MNKSIFALALTLLAGASSATAQYTGGYAAQQPTWYGKISLVQTDPDVESALYGGETKGLDDSTGYYLGVGYQMNQFVALEAGLLDFGEASLKDSYVEGSLEVNGWRDEVSDKLAVSATTVAFGTVLSTDSNQPFSAGLKVGFHLWEAESSYSRTRRFSWTDWDGSVVTEAYSDSDRVSDDGNDLYYGVVGTYRAEGWMLSLEHTIYKIEDLKPASTALSFGLAF